ncbi:hypothetical protein GCM10023196_049200 [Actinoallomurus vinaceus]|uniref:4Fe-4S Wbl-type domain-containing protein n=1 Tax=Actinoallomurus vinaceus TaxID=1080074 RepID=A0ABP8UEF0_9ACTN
MHNRQIPASEASHALILLSRLRHTAIAILDQHVLREGRCRICQTTGVCPAAMLADNNLAIFSDLTALPLGDGDEGPPSAPP